MINDSDRKIEINKVKKLSLDNFFLENSTNNFLRNLSYGLNKDWN